MRNKQWPQGSGARGGASFGQLVQLVSTSSLQLLHARFCIFFLNRGIVQQNLMITNDYYTHSCQLN